MSLLRLLCLLAFAPSLSALADSSAVGDANNWLNFNLGRLAGLGGRGQENVRPPPPQSRRRKGNKPKFGQKLTPRLPHLGSLWMAGRKSRNKDTAEARSFQIDKRVGVAAGATETLNEEQEATKLSFLIRFGDGKGKDDDSSVLSSLERPDALRAEVEDAEGRGGGDTISKIVETLLDDDGEQLTFKINGQEFKTKFVRVGKQQQQQQQEDEKFEDEVAVNQRIDVGSTEEAPKTTTVKYGYTIKDKIAYRSKIRHNPDGGANEEDEGEGKGQRKRKGKSNKISEDVEDSASSPSASSAFLSDSPLAPVTAPVILTPPSPTFLLGTPPQHSHGLPPPTPQPFYLSSSFGGATNPNPLYSFSYSTRPPYYHTTLPPFRHHPPVTQVPYQPVKTDTKKPSSPRNDGGTKPKLRVLHVSPKPPGPPPDQFTFESPKSSGKSGGKKSSYVFQSMGHGPSSTSFSYDIANGKVNTYKGDHIVSPHQEGKRKVVSELPRAIVTTPSPARIPVGGPTVVRHVPTMAPRFGYTITHTPLPRRSKQLSVNLTPDAAEPTQPSPKLSIKSTTLPPLTFSTQDSDQTTAPLKVPPRTKGLPLSAPIGKTRVVVESSPPSAETTTNDFGFIAATEQNRAASTPRSQEEDTRTGNSIRPTINIGVAKGRLPTFETTTTLPERETSEDTTNSQEDESTLGRPTISIKSRRRKNRKRPTRRPSAVRTATSTASPREPKRATLQPRIPQQLAVLGESGRDGRRIVKSILEVLAENIDHPNKDEVLDELKDQLNKEEALRSIKVVKNTARSEEEEEGERNGGGDKSNGLTFDLFDPFAPFKPLEENNHFGELGSDKSSASTTEEEDYDDDDDDGRDYFGTIGDDDEEETVTYFPTTERSGELEEEELFATTAPPFLRRRQKQPTALNDDGRRRGDESTESTDRRRITLDYDDFDDDSGQLQSLEDFALANDGRVEHLLLRSNSEEAKRVEQEIHEIYRDQEFVGTTSPLETTATAVTESEETVTVTPRGRSRFASRGGSRDSESIAATTPSTTPKSANPNRARQHVKRVKVAATTTEAAQQQQQQRKALRLRGQRIRARARRPPKASEEGEEEGEENIETFNGVSIVQIPAHLRKNPDSIVVEPVFQDISGQGD